jgi:glycosyltransferase involved in cell wall biosynthesis
MRVSQVLCAAGPVDAVTNQGLACRALFTSWGWDGADYSAVIAPGVSRDAIRHLHELSPGADEVLLLHYSGYAHGLEEVFEPAGRSLLISHNVTPARYFWEHEPVDAVRCELGRDQLAKLTGRIRALAGVSDYNAQELRELSSRDASVIPVLFDRAALPPAGPPPSPDAPPTILFVGRLTPHKRQDLVIRAFARFREARPDARLALVGVPITPGFGEQLERLANDLAPGAVTFESGISAERLAERYRSAHAFLCLSEHEGFCIPLLEAFHYGVPVIARDRGAIAEVVGDAGVLLADGDGLQTIAELLRIVTGDQELRAELAARGARRLAVYEIHATAAKLRSALEELA